MICFSRSSARLKTSNNRSITVKNSNLVEIEANVVGGSISIADSTLVEVAGNTVKGSIKCTNVTPFTDGDHTPNTVGGSNNCP